MIKKVKFTNVTQTNWGISLRVLWEDDEKGSRSFQISYNPDLGFWIDSEYESSDFVKSVLSEIVQEAVFVLVETLPEL